MSKKQLQLGILCVLVGVVGWLGFTRFQEMQQRQAEEARGQAQAKAFQEKVRLAQEKAKLAREKAEVSDFGLDRTLPRNYPRPVSDWTENEKAFYRKVLSRGQFDVLVAPLQIQQWGFDRATRSVMSAQLATAVARAQNAKVPDPYLVARAVGDGQRTLKLDDFYSLANATGVKRIIWGYVGHDRKGGMIVTIKVQDLKGEKSAATTWVTPITTQKFENISFNDTRSPIAAFDSQLPKIIGSIGLNPTTGMQHPVEARLDARVLPQLPLELFEGTDNPVRHAYAFLLLAALTPESIPRTKERFAEKAILALGRVSPSSPEYRALQSRAYMVMGYRPAAVAALGTPQTEEEKALLAALNGNLTDLRVLNAKEQNQWKRLLQKMDEVRMALNYELANSSQALAELKGLALPGKTWPYLTARALTDSDVWAQHENVHVKLLLDQEIPLKGYSLEEIARESVSLGDASKLRTTIELSVFNHVRKFVESGSAKWCCELSVNRPSVLDYLDLLDAIGHDNLIRRIDFLADVQGMGGPAMEYANSLEAIYRGFPCYAVGRSKAALRYSSTLSGAEQQGMNKTAFEEAISAAFWEQGQSVVSSHAFNQFSRLRVRSFDLYDNPYYVDIPYKPYYWTWAAGGNPQVQRENNNAAIKNATWQIGTVTKQLEFLRFIKDEASVKPLLESIHDRFVGSPQRNELLARQEILRGNNKGAEQYYRQNIERAPSYWPSYERLGTMLFESGEVSAAARIFRSFPEFRKDLGQDRVLTSNRAFDVGSLFYWSGHFDLAKPLYSVAAGLRTGAASDMSSALRLKLLDGDISGALKGSYERARRYNDSYAYRDYLGMLHASGQSKDAWVGFAALIRDVPEPHVWETALVGHHISGTSEAEVAKWLQEDNIRNTAERTNSAAKYLVRFATTDRIPSKELPALVDGLDHATWFVGGESPMVLRSYSDGRLGRIMGPMPPGADLALPPLNVPAASDKRKVKSNLAYFSEGYRAVKLGDFPAAKTIFDEAATLYNMAKADTESGFMLPYYALAAAKAGDTAVVEAILKRFDPKDQRFDYYLAKAVIAAIAGKTNDALQALGYARYRRPHTESRPLLTQYTYGDICDLLARTTGNARIRAVALNWARQSQKFEPWHSWGYAIEARLTTNAADRKRAIAMTHYLDPKSERLSAFKKPEIDEAVRAYARANPFLRKPAPQPVRNET